MLINIQSTVQKQWKKISLLLFVSFFVLLFLYVPSINKNIPVSSMISKVEVGDVPSIYQEIKTISMVDLASQKIAIQHFQEYQNSVPAYMQGTELRGSLLIDDNGDLRITDQIKKRFDYFYLLSGDKTPSHIKDIIRGHLLLTLKEPALQTALELLDSYGRYINEYKNLIENLTPQDAQSDLMWLAQEIINLKESVFGEAVAKIFFGNEDALRQESLRLMALNKVSPLEQVQMIEGTDSSLSQEVIGNRKKTLSYYNTKQKIQGAVDNGAQADEITALRNELYGKEATQRLQKMDSRRQRWQRIISAYQQVKGNLISNGGLSDTDLQNALDVEMRQSYQLTAGQLRRLAALDRITN